MKDATLKATAMAVAFVLVGGTVWGCATPRASARRTAAAPSATEQTESTRKAAPSADKTDNPRVTVGGSVVVRVESTK